MYILHMANKNYSSWSLRAWLVLRMLEIPFTEHLIALPATDSFETYRAFSPNGRVPCLEDGDMKIWDLLAIVEYLAERHPSVWPQDNARRAWARSAAAEMHSGFNALRDECGMSCGVRVEIASLSAALRQDLFRLDDLWNEGLKRFGGPFLAGEHFCAADAFFAPVAFRAQTYNLPFEGAAADYLARLRDLPPMREWYEDGLKETWREPGHEADVLRAGTVRQDFRAS